MLCLGFIWFVVLGRVHAIEARAEAAEQTNAAKNLFLANMSHELRTPLNSIIGFSEILASQTFGPLGGDNYVEYAEDIQVSGRHLLGVVNDILLMSKLDADPSRSRSRRSRSRKSSANPPHGRRRRQGARGRSQGLRHLRAAGGSGRPSRRCARSSSTSWATP
ncbi:MAG: histidine kinase dimerization/phospho-acceptor domain-containing protein [Alphaproteobacteria bacterium]